MAKQVRAAAERRIATAEAQLELASAEPRHPAEVLAEAGAIADWMLQRAKAHPAGEDWSTQELESLVQSLERAARLAKVQLDANLDERRARLSEAHANQMSAIFSRTLNGLDLSPHQRALVPSVLKREIEAYFTQVPIQAEVVSIESGLNGGRS